MLDLSYEKRKNSLHLIEDGMVVSGDREFTRLVGGFNDDESALTTKQIAELMGYDIKVINQTINRNIKAFDKGLHILDLKEVTLSDYNLELLNSIGYSKMSIAKAKNMYILSKAGFLLYLKFAEGDKAVELYKEFLEDYFKTKAENVHMKNGIADQIKQLEEKRAMKLGMSIMTSDMSDRAKFMQESEDINKQIIEMQNLLSKEEVIKSLQPKLHVGELIENAKNDYDIGVFAKFINLPNMGRNKMFEWLRDSKILMHDNTPYQKYINYFNIIPVTKGVFTQNKTLLKAKGVDFIVKRLIKDGKLITKSVEEIIKELPKAN